MDAKGIKDQIEGVPDAARDIVDDIDWEATNPLLINYIIVPYELEGMFVVLLAHQNFVGRVLEEINQVSWRNVVHEDIECKVENAFRLLAPEGIHCGFIANSRRVYLEH